MTTADPSGNTPAGTVVCWNNTTLTIKGWDATLGYLLNLPAGGYLNAPASQIVLGTCGSTQISCNTPAANLTLS
jgi:hypothetical protein